jgi:mannose-6-phosphate isomerase-like protein (cupin superfamily)
MPTNAVSQEAVSRAWDERGFSCGLWVDPPGRAWEDFRHDVDELVVVLDGELEIVVSDAVIHPHPGEEVLIPAGARHSVRNLGRTYAHWLFGYQRRG